MSVVFCVAKGIYSYYPKKTTKPNPGRASYNASRYQSDLNPHCPIQALPFPVATRSVWSIRWAWVS